MGLTQCPNCHRRCFTDAASCASCYQTFKPGVLQAQAIAEEKAFSTKSHVLFFSLFLIALALLLFVQLQAYLYRI
jgi:hypothetical protein